MKVILRQEYSQLGKIGDVIEVKDGYARNFLIPRKIAFPATPSNLRRFEEEKARMEIRKSRELLKAKKIAEQLEKTSITLSMKVGEDEKIFGSVTTQMIADALKEKGFSIDKRIIELPEPVKALGIYTVHVNLAGGIVGKLKMWVVRE